MGGYYPDTGLFEQRNRFRPVHRHEITGRGANSGGRRAGGAILLETNRSEQKKAETDRQKPLCRSE